jgi:hypothetical protein
VAGNRAFIIQVPFLTASLRLPEDAIYVEVGTPYVHLHWGEHTAVLTRLPGPVGGDLVYHGVGTPKIMEGLAHLGKRIGLLRDVWADIGVAELPAKAWLRARGLKEKGGQPVALHCFAGDNREAIGRDHEEIE